MKTWKEILRMPCELGDGEGGGCDEDCPCCLGDGVELPRWVLIAGGTYRTEPDKSEMLRPYLDDLWRLQDQAVRLELMMPRNRDRIRRDFEAAVRSVDEAARAALESLEASA